MANTVRITTQVNDQASRPINDIHQAWIRLQKSGAEGLFAGVGAAATLQAFSLVQNAVSGIGQVLGDATRAALEDEASIAGLNAALKANVDAFDGNTSAIEATIKSRMRLGFADEEQRDSLARLVGVTHDSNAALALQSTAMDLAAFKHISLADATQTLINIEGGRYKQLAALIGSTKDITSATDAMAAVQAVAAGSAEALANTQGGKLKASQIAIGESMEKIGGVLLPAVVAGMQTLAGVVETVAGVFKTFGDILGGIGDAIGGVNSGIAEMANQHNREADATAAYNAALTALQAEFAAGTITQDEYLRKSQELSDQQDQLIQSTDGFQHATAEASDTMDEATLKAQWLTAQHLDLAAATDQTGGMALNSSNSFRTEISALDSVKDSAITAASGLFGMQTATANLDAQSQALNHTLDATALYLLSLGKGAEALSVAEAAAQNHAGEASVTLYQLGGAATHATGATRGLTQAQRDAAKTLQDTNRAAFASAEASAKKYFDAVHAANLKAIQDAHDLASARIAEERRAVNAQLAEQLRLNAAPADAAEAALRDTQNAQTRRNLVEALNAAQAGTTDANGVTTVDPIAVRDATEALQNFDAQLNIAALREQQAIADEKARADAAAAQTALDTAQSKVDEKAKTDTAAENQRYKDQAAAFKTSLSDVEKNTKKGADASEAIAKVLGAYGVTGSPTAKTSTTSSGGTAAVTLGFNQSASDLTVAMIAAAPKDYPDSAAGKTLIEIRDLLRAPNSVALRILAQTGAA